ncbi:oxygenase MpaB family protein [Nocardia takedensis]|uniref:oxygenase MpaB family protein n=1 Tax=Nocardia takedensis TaxID=259390 RepID=UPI0003174F70|nr:oxygenase MpaB family protein [Nocardia takedensis]
MTTTLADTETEPVTLGPDSLLWKYFGDWRTMLMAPAAGIMQLMLPGLGAGVTQHSDFFNEPWERIFRSIPQIAGTVYDGPEAVATAAAVRDYHRDIKGIDADGNRYHALDPEVYYWAHATFIWAAMMMADIFDHRLSDAEKQRMYDESKQWYRLYGVSERPMPEDWYAFRAYFDRMCAQRLVVTESAEWVVRQLDRPAEMRLPYVPEVVWKLFGTAFMHQYRLIAAGTMPPVIRERLGLPWGPWERRQFKLRVAVVRRVWPLLPERVRYQPRALAGIARERAAG